MKKEYIKEQNKSADILENKGFKLQGLDINNNVCVLDKDNNFICDKDYKSILNKIRG